MSALIRIYLVQRGVDVTRWLCTRCLKTLEEQGWTVRKSEDPPHDELKCDGEACMRARGQEAE